MNGFEDEAINNSEGDTDELKSVEIIYVPENEEKSVDKQKIKKTKQSNKKQKKTKERAKKGNGYFKKSVLLVAGAAVFGLIAGEVFNYVSKDTLRELKEIKQSQAEQPEHTSTIDTINSSDSGESTIDAVSMNNNAASGMDVSAIASEVMPSVVSIYVTAVAEYNQGFFGSYQYETEGSGSGIIIDQNDEELLIVTNNHVVSDAKTVNVGFIDGESYDAKVKATDSDLDLAIIVVPIDDIKADTMSAIKIATLGDSDSLQVGQQVVAIGNALGYGQSVTTGIVSAKDRENETNTTPLIQTDAAINPGNSGGALLNMKGEVVGINSSKYASTEVEGIGYAIPVSSVKKQLNSLMNEETRDKVDEDDMGYLGISCSTVTQDMIYYYGAPEGVFVAELFEGLGAEKAGIPEKSIITKIDGKRVKSVDELTNILSYYKAGEKVSIEYSVMENNEYVTKEASVVLSKKPED